MSRYRQQLKRVRKERAPEIAKEIAARPPRQVREDEPFPGDTVNDEIVEVVNQAGKVVARVKILPGRRLRILDSA